MNKINALEAFKVSAIIDDVSILFSHSLTFFH